MTESSRLERIDALVQQWRNADQAGRRIPLAELCRDCPELIPHVAQKLGQIDATLNLEATTSPVSVASPLPDQIGDFRIVQLLGQGGMGAVYLAEDVRLRRRVALKVMKPEVASNPDSAERFLREARAAAALEHDHILAIYTVGEAKLADGRPLLYLAMPLLKGEPLDARIRRNEGQPLPLIEQVIIGRQIAEGLSAAHDEGLIHRDIKPANIWIESRPDGSIRAKILDFGLARSNQDVQLTNSGAMLGTPAYIAPEQASAQKIDGRADLFSLGCTMYLMATGKLPFSGSNLMEVLIQIATVEPPTVKERNPSLPSAYSAIIQKLMAKKPENRFATATEAAKALRAIEQSMTLPDVPMAMLVEHSDTIHDSPPIVVPVPKKRNRLSLMLGAGALLAVACGIVVLKSMGPNATGTEPSIAEVTKGEDKGKAVVQQPEPKVGPKLIPIAMPFKANEPIGPATLVTKPMQIANGAGGGYSRRLGTRSIVKRAFSIGITSMNR